jgi:hypothetical protein
MNGSLGGWPELVTLVGVFLVGPLAVDLALLFLALRLATSGPRRILLLVPLALYLTLNVAAPLAVIGIYFREYWEWLLALFLFMKFLEFGPFKVGALYLEMWTKARRGAASSDPPSGPDPDSL